MIVSKCSRGIALTTSVLFRNDSLYPVRSALEFDTSKRDTLPFITCCNSCTQCTGSNEDSACHVQGRPLVDQSMRRRALCDTLLDRLVLQRCTFHVVHLCSELIIHWRDEQDSERHDARQEDRGCEIELESRRFPVLCSPVNTHVKRRHEVGGPHADMQHMQLPARC
jgi:hypothetical protein